MLTARSKDNSSNLKLTNGSCVAVIGGGPAGSLFSFFFLEMVQRANVDMDVDIFEPRDFSRTGPAGCNMCGGVISESLVQTLATEGIILPPNVIQRGLDFYVFHMDEGSVLVNTPLDEKRIAAVHRGAGPRGVKKIKWKSFDSYLLNLSLNKGANLVQERVDNISLYENRPLVKTQKGSSKIYDLLVVAVGVNTSLKLYKDLDINYKPPQTTKTYINEFYLGQESIEKYLGSAIHVFLLNIPQLEFAALIPKGEHVTLCLMGNEIDEHLVQSFLNSPKVKQAFPPNWRLSESACHCSPRINIHDAFPTFADRIVFIGDCGVTRLYKDGIGAAYRTAKAAAVTAVFEGVSAKDFHRYFWPTCKSISNDNKVGRIIFSVSRIIQKLRYARRGILRMTSLEQILEGKRRRMSMVLWDIFSGSSSYQDIFLRTIHPYFLSRLFWNIIVGNSPLYYKSKSLKEDIMKTSGLGKIYKDGEVIVKEGEKGNSMYVIQEGKVEVTKQKGGKDIRLLLLTKGDFFGEMALFDREVRSATARSIGESRILTIDKRAFLRRIHEDPSLAYRIVKKMSHRIRALDSELVRIKSNHRSRV